MINVDFSVDMDCFLFGIKRFSDKEVASADLDSVWVLFFAIFSIVIFVEAEDE